MRERLGDALEILDDDRTGGRVLDVEAADSRIPAFRLTPATQETSILEAVIVRPRASSQRLNQG
jgi:hypothetical protein